MPSKEQLNRSLGRHRTAIERAKETGIEIAGEPFTVALSHGSFGFEAEERGPVKGVKSITFLISKELLSYPPHGAEVTITDEDSEGDTFTIASHRDQGEHWLIKAATHE